MLGETLSHYKIQSELGHGGMGVVYLAADTKLDRIVAIKFLAADLTRDSVAKERFVREAKAAAAVEHESICAIYEIGETDDGQTYIVMPFYEGKTLKEMIAEGAIEPYKVMDLAGQVAGGLAAAHAKGVVHRDIKPGNILVGKRGRVKILDFGLAKLGGQMDITKSRSSLGTVPYMAPEQIRNETIDQRTDIWALGAVMYEMLTGSRPFRGEYEQAVTYSILNVDPEPLAGRVDNLPAGFENVVLRCLAKNPADRYQSPVDLLKDIELPSGVKPFTGTITRGPVTQEESKSANKIAMIAVLAAVVLGVAFVLFSQRSGGTRSAQRHVAILPFRVEGATDDAEAFSFGLLESLTSNLARIGRKDSTFWVIPSSEVDADMTVSEAGRELNASMVVTGSLQFEGDRIRLNLDINDPAERQIINSDQIEYTGTSRFAIQDAAVLSLGRMLNVVQGADTQPSLAGNTSRVRSANESYLKAVGYLRNQQSLAEIDIAIGLFHSAIQDDSVFAGAYAGLGEAYLAKHGRTKNPRWLTEAIAMSQTALRMNENLPEANILLGRVHGTQSDHEASLAAYQRALELDPENADAYRFQSSAFRGMGRMEEGEAAARKSIELEPDYWRAHYTLALHFYRQQRWADAVAAAQPGLLLSPDNVTILNLQAAALWAQGLVAEAVAGFEKITELDPDYAPARKNTATGLFYLQRYAASAAAYEQVVMRLAPNDYDVRGNLADAYYWTPGRKQDAMLTYRQAVDLAREHLRVSPDDPEAFVSMAGYFMHLDMPDSSTKYLDLAVASYDPGNIPAPTAFGIGETYLGLGEADKAKRWLEQGLSGGSGVMSLKFSPWLAQLRDDVEFMQRIAVYMD